MSVVAATNVVYVALIFPTLRISWSSNQSGLQKLLMKKKMLNVYPVSVQLFFPMSGIMGEIWMRHADMNSLVSAHDQIRE